MKTIVALALIFSIASTTSFDPLLTQLKEKVATTDYALRMVDLVELSLM